MKRYGIYISVILILLSGSYSKSFSQVDNSDIVSIQLAPPLIVDTICDPLEAALIIGIEMKNYTICGMGVPLFLVIGGGKIASNSSRVRVSVSNNFCATASSLSRY